MIEQKSVLWVQVLEAKPNKLFTEEQRSTVRFLRYSRAVECAECGRRSKSMWTLLLSFEAKSLKAQQFTLAASGKIHPPLTPVCGTHLLAVAEMPELPKRKRKKHDEEPVRMPETGEAPRQSG